LLPEEIPNAQAQVALPLVESFQPCLFPRQFGFLAAEGVRIAQFREELDRVFDSVNAEIQVIHLPKLNQDIRLLRRRIGLAR
jgi:hypothetical protein